MCLLSGLTPQPLHVSADRQAVASLHTHSAKLVIDKVKNDQHQLHCSGPITYYQAGWPVQHERATEEAARHLPSED